MIISPLFANTSIKKRSIDGKNPLKWFLPKFLLSMTHFLFFNIIPYHCFFFGCFQHFYPKFLCYFKPQSNPDFPLKNPEVSFDIRNNSSVRLAIETLEQKLPQNIVDYIIYAPSVGVDLNAFTVLSRTTCASLPESRIVF